MVWSLVNHSSQPKFWKRLFKFNLWKDPPMKPEFVQADGSHHGFSNHDRLFSQRKTTRRSRWDLALDYMGTLTYIKQNY